MQVQRTDVNEDIDKAVVNFGGWKNEVIKLTYVLFIGYFCISAKEIGKR